jgi:UDP-glucuronate decarboxylase
MLMSINRHRTIEEDLIRIVSAELPWPDLDGATVLITGAYGFVAAYITETLLFLNEQKAMRNPIKVLALGRSREKTHQRFAAHHARPDLQFILQDVSDPLKLAVDQRIDYIIHAAALASPKYFSPNPVGTFKPDVMGMYHLLERARTTEVRGFLFISSIEVYGKFERPPPNPITENQFGILDPLELRACYAEGKRACETMCRAWAHQYGVPTRIARLAHTYGPGMTLDDGRVFADFVANVVHNEDIVLKSDGSALRVFCYIADAVAGLFTVLLKGETANAYNVVNEECEIRIFDLARLLCDMFPEKALKVVPLDRAAAANQAVWNNGFPVSPKKLQALGWQPCTSLESGFRRTILSYQNEARLTGRNEG